MLMMEYSSNIMVVKRVFNYGYRLLSILRISGRLLGLGAMVRGGIGTELH